MNIQALTDPERATQSVTIQRSVDGGTTWVDVGTDNSSPVYSVRDDLAALALPDGTEVLDIAPS